MQNVIMLTVFVLNAFMLKVIMLNVDMLNVAAPKRFLPDRNSAYRRMDSSFGSLTGSLVGDDLVL